MKPADGLGLVIRDPYYDFGTFPDAPEQPNLVMQERMLAQVAFLGARSIRLELHASGPTWPADLARNDALLQLLAPRYRLRPLVVAGFGLIRDEDPRTLNDGPFEEHPRFGGGVSPLMARWLERALSAALRWGPLVEAYEIFNEQNRLPTPGGRDGVQPVIIARLLTKFFRLLHAAAREQQWPRVPLVISGGLHPAGTATSPFVSDLAYLEAMYRSEAFTGYADETGRYPLDGIGYHPYPVEIRNSSPRPERVLNDGELMLRRTRMLTQLRDTLHPGAPIWITEIGHNAAYLRQSRQSQVQALYDAAALLQLPGVERLFWFKYEDFPPATGRFAQQWGLVTIPFVEGPCPGGACYETNAPVQTHPAWEVFYGLTHHDGIATGDGEHPAG